MTDRQSQDANPSSIYLEDNKYSPDHITDEQIAYWESEDEKQFAASSQTLSSSHQEDDHPDEDEDNQTSSPRQYSMTELIRTLGSETGGTSQLHPELERRVLDFRLAQKKRSQKHGEQQGWGIFGMYANLSNVRIDLEWAEDAAWRRNHKAPYLTWSDFDEARRKGGRNRPWFTYSLIMACSVMLIVEFGLNGWKVEPLNVNPLIGPSAEALIRAGARDTAKIVEEGQWFRIFSPLLLHAGLVHYVINMAALWFIGGAIEQSHGIVNTTLLFLIPGVGGNILSAIFLPQVRPFICRKWSDSRSLAPIGILYCIITLMTDFLLPCASSNVLHL
jgi:membrane associated rhomboid family serine protease